MSGLFDIGSNLPDQPDPLGIGTDFAGAGNNIPGFFNIVGGSQGEGLQQFTDPLDLFGVRAQQTTERINQIIEESAARGIALNEAQLAEIEALTQPFRDAATDVALPNLEALAKGGDIDFQPSQLFKAQLEQGREGIITGQAGGGAGIKSSNTFEKLSDLVSNLASEDVGRFESGQQALLRPGTTAEQSLKNSGVALTGNIRDILSNLGASTAASANSLAQQQSAQGQTAQNLGSGIGSLIVANQGGN